MIRLAPLMLSAVALAACSVGPSPNLVGSPAGRGILAVETPPGVTATRADQLARFTCQQRDASAAFVSDSEGVRLYRCLPRATQRR